MEDKSERPAGAVLTGGASVVEAPITLPTLILSPKAPVTPGLARTAFVYAPFFVDLHVRDSAGPDPATRTSASIVEEARGALSPLFLTTLLVRRIAHRYAPPKLMTSSDRVMAGGASYLYAARRGM